MVSSIWDFLPIVNRLVSTLIGSFSLIVVVITCSRVFRRTKYILYTYRVSFYVVLLILLPRIQVQGRGVKRSVY